MVLDALNHKVQIVSDAPGGSCELTDNGRFGLLYENEKALLQAIVTAKSNPMHVDCIINKNFFAILI